MWQEHQGRSGKSSRTGNGGHVLTLDPVHLEPSRRVTEGRYEPSFQERRTRVTLKSSIRIRLRTMTVKEDVFRLEAVSF